MGGNKPLHRHGGSSAWERKQAQRPGYHCPRHDKKMTGNTRRNKEQKSRKQVMNAKFSEVHNLFGTARSPHQGCRFFPSPPSRQTWVPTASRLGLRPPQLVPTITPSTWKRLQMLVAEGTFSPQPQRTRPLLVFRLSPSHTPRPHRTPTN